MAGDKEAEDKGAEAQEKSLDENVFLHVCITPHPDLEGTWVHYKLMQFGEDLATGEQPVTLGQGHVGGQFMILKAEDVRCRELESAKARVHELEQRLAESERQRRELERSKP